MIRGVKRILSAVICVTLLAGFMPFYTANASIKESAITGTDYKKLESIGIVREADRLGAEVYLTRGMLIRIALRMGGFAEKISVETMSNPFDDISEKDMYYNDAMSAYAVGLISGGSVRVNDYARQAEAAKLLTGVLGYGEQAESSGGYPAGYVSFASRLDILPKETAEGILMTEFLRVVTKALNTELLQIERFSPGSGSMVYDRRTGETLLSKVFGIYSANGILQSDRYTDIYGKKATGTDRVVIGGTAFSAGNVDLDGLLGAHIEIYYKNDSGEKELIYAGLMKGRNDIITIDSADIAGVADDGMSFSYYETNGSIKDIQLERDTVCVYNFEQTAVTGELLRFEKQEGGGSVTLPGTVTVIDNDNDGEYEVINVVAYKTMRIQKISSKDYTVYNDAGDKLEMDESVSVRIWRNGKTAAFSELQIGDVLLYASSSGNRKNYVEVRASSKTVSGTLESVAEDTVIIDGEEFRIYKEIGKKMNAGNYAVFYLNERGEIYDYDETFAMVFGYLRAVDTKQGVDQGLIFQIFTENNRWVELTFANRVTVNGVRKSQDEIRQDIEDELYGGNELISYSVNAEGRINKLETAQKITEHWGEAELELIEENKFRLSYELENQRFRQGPSSFEDNFIIDGTTKLFFVSEESTGDKADYFIGSTSQIVADKEYKKVSAYNVSKGGIAEAVVIESGVIQDIDSSGLLVVVGKSKVLTADGEVCSALSLFYGGEKISIPLKDDSLITGENNVAVGDVVQIAVDNVSGRITAITKRYDSSLGYEQKMLIGAVYAAPSYVMGQICYADAEKRSIILDYGTKTGIMSAKSCKVYIYNRERNIVEAGDLSDLYASQYCVIRATYLQAKECIVFK